MKMKLLLLSDVPHLGRARTIVEVTEAYARNFLLPKKLAVLATTDVLAAHRRRQEKSAAIKQVQAAERSAAAVRLSGATVRLTAKANDQGTLFAAVKSEAVLADVRRQFGLRLEGAHISPDHLKRLGRQSVTLRLPDGQELLMAVEISHG